MRQPTNPPPVHTGRRIAGRAQNDPATDPYHPRRQPAGPVVCPRCQVVHHDGRWQWGAVPAGAQPELCPACRRVEDEFPAGAVTLHGTFAPPRRDEIVALVRHQEAAEKAEHALNRIIGIEENPDSLVVTTTDIHLPHRIGRALQRAFHGKLESSFDEDGYFAQVEWFPPKP